MAPHEVITVEERADASLRITIDRPHARNALDSAALRALAAGLRRAARDRAVGVVVLRGAGDRAFSTGADLKELQALDREAASDFLVAGQQVFRLIETLGKPVVAEVDGYALGGGFELCLACTFVVASTRSTFALPEAGIGLIPGFGGTQRLARTVGRQRALRVALLGEMLSAAQAYDLGLLALGPVEPDALATAVDTLVETLRAKSPSALAAIIESVDAASASSLDVGLRLETGLARDARESADGREGVASFLEKRPPRFAGIAIEGVSGR